MLRQAKAGVQESDRTGAIVLRNGRHTGRDTRIAAEDRHESPDVSVLEIGRASRRSSAEEVGLTEEDIATYPTLVSALTPAHTHFRAVAQARMYSRLHPSPDSPDASMRQQAMARFYPNLVRAFEARYGTAQYHWCEHAMAAAVLTSTGGKWSREDHLWLVLNPTGLWPAGETMLQDCEILKDEIEDVLTGSARRRCLAMLFAVVTTCLAMLDESGASSKDSAEAKRPSALRRATETVRRLRRLPSATEGRTSDASVARVMDRLQAVRRHYGRAARRTIQLNYLGGMATCAIGVILAIGAVLAFGDESVAAELEAEPSDMRRAATAALSGAAGAVVSVLLRMTTERGIDIDVQVGRVIARVLGASRPGLGALFGTVMYLLLASGLIPIEADNTAYLTQFYAAFAFASGFSEQLVPDMLGLAAKQIKQGPG